jgi:hypothetical protein
VTPVTLRVTPLTKPSRTLTQPHNHAVTHRVTQVTPPRESPATPYKGARDPRVTPHSIASETVA